MGRLSARAAGDAGASVAVANRSASAAEALAASVGARTEAYDPDDRIGRFAGVIVALAGPWPIGAATMEVLARSTTVVVDLSVPPAVLARPADLLGVRLITADAIAVADPEPGAQQDGPAGRFETLIEDATGEFIAWQRRRDGRTTAQALVERADRERQPGVGDGEQLRQRPLDRIGCFGLGELRNDRKEVICSVVPSAGEREHCDDDERCGEEREHREECEGRCRVDAPMADESVDGAAGGQPPSAPR